jgi:hypothetical protein
MWDVIRFGVESAPLRGIALFFEEIADFVPGAVADVFEDDEGGAVFVDPFEHALEGPSGFSFGFNGFFVAI